MKYLFPLFLLTSIAFSQDVLKLKNGKVYEGLFFGERNGNVIFKINGESGTKSFKADEVISVGKKDQDIVPEGNRTINDILTLKDGNVYEGKFFGKTGSVIVFKRKNFSSTEKFPLTDIQKLKTSSGIEILLVSTHRAYFYNGSIKEGLFDEKLLEENKPQFKEYGTAEWVKIHPNKIKSIQTLDGKEIFPFFIANSESGIFHLSYVRHIPDKSKQKLFDNVEDAKNTGFKPCIACFDSRPMITDFNLERSLVKSTIIAFQNNNEILYEHKDLQKVMKMLDKVLAGWPDELKGYEYRIQIYRDATPNALAIGGGNLYISSGLLNLSETDEELESIIAHEVAHVERRHTLRQFYENQRNQSNAALATVIVGVAVLAAGGDASDVGAATTITAAIGDYAAELALKGYSRDLEEEADIMAQLYINQKGGSFDPFIAVLDKFATSSIVKGELLSESVNAFASHPSLIRRIKQVESAEIYNYETPMLFTITPTKEEVSDLPGSVNIKIASIYKAHSSIKKDMDMFYLIGSIDNNHPEWSFKLNDIKFRMPGSTSQINLDGISGQTILSGGEGDFSGILYAPTSNADVFFAFLKDKKIIPNTASLSAIVMKNKKGATKKVPGYRNINSSISY